MDDFEKISINLNSQITMKSLRVGLCSSRFWPDVSCRSWWNQDFCRSMLEESKHQLIVFTTRWASENPESFVWQGITVNRAFENVWNPFGTSIGSPFGLLSFTRQLKKALSQTSPAIDLLAVNDTPRRSIAAIQVARRLQLPVLVRIDDAWPRSHAWQKMLSRLVRLDEMLGDKIAWIASSTRMASSVEQKLPVQVVEEGVYQSEPVFPLEFDKFNLRESLSVTHPVLATDAKTQLVIYAGPIRERSGLSKLVAAWSHLRERLPEARFWISGKGRGEDETWRSIVRFQLNNEVVMTGTFDGLDDILRAADLYVLPQPSDGIDDCQIRYVKKAMLNSLPVFVPETAPGNLVRHGLSGYCYPDLEANQLADLWVQYLTQPEQTQSVCSAAKMQVVADHDFRQTGKRYLQIMNRLVQS